MAPPCVIGRSAGRAAKSLRAAYTKVPSVGDAADCSPWAASGTTSACTQWRSVARPPSETGPSKRSDGRNRLRRIRWAGLVDYLDNDEITRSLLAARGARPERRPPTLLSTRCLRGALDGTVGAGPLARLLDVEVDDMIEALNSIGPKVAEAIDGDFSSPLDPADVTTQGFDEDPVAA